MRKKAQRAFGVPFRVARRCFTAPHRDARASPAKAKHDGGARINNDKIHAAGDAFLYQEIALSLLFYHIFFFFCFSRLLFTKG